MTSSTSWVPGVTPETPFSLANIPFGVISTKDNPTLRPAVAIGSHALDLKALDEGVSLGEIVAELKGHEHVFQQTTLNAFAALGRPVHQQVRTALRDLLTAGSRHAAKLQENEELKQKALIPLSQVKMHMPMAIGDYTDFYAGYHHAFAVGSMFRGPAAALQPNYTHLPVGYHGRASSIVVSDTPVRRPWGQILLDPAAEPKQPTTAPCRRLDFELELGCFISTPSEQGTPVKIGEAEDHIFGYVLLNDWSARDIQSWEYVPLGPFNSKNFASTISPWVVLADALEPFRTKGIENTTPVQEYMKEDKAETAIDISLEVDITTPEGDTTTITRTSAKQLMWSFPQMIAHHTLGGCNMRTGDMLGSGTISGTEPGARGSLLELSEGGKKDVMLYGMDMRRFLKDGDTVTIRGVCGGSGERVGFGECAGRVYSAVQR
ncbi:Fumarylacetoacetase [Apiospora rasikravindrae]|uniref:Fumarylacetoacetase n=1 Tax=Apiospora rasikravindrae TaxID=990691 RepID=A0ABR1SCW6_9PEZI